MTSCSAPVRHDAKHLSTITIILTIVSWVLLIQRFFCKILAKLPLGLDDWLVLVTAISGVVSSTININHVLPSGLGRDVWTLKPDQIYQFGFYFYIVSVLYPFQVTTLKLAMLCLYLRIFPSEGIRKVIWGTAAIVCAFGVTFILASTTACRPISHIWNKWDGEHEGRCVDIALIAWTNAAISIALSLWLIVIPLWKVRSLEMKRHKKVGVAIMFILGTFDTIVSILRLSSLISFRNNVNATLSYAQVIKWSTIEINVGLYCVCIPTLRLVLVEVYSKLLATRRALSGGNEYGTSNSRRRVHGWPRNTIITSRIEMDPSGRERWQHGSRVNDNGDKIYRFRQALKPGNAIVGTKTSMVTYDETDEEELISSAQACQKELRAGRSL
ncbi:hypothetical protein FOQG_15331 [Fusarium oxysporum f. sp. raphani 54005]|uniref:Rhodopsin domain-containing protein n=3 Tax=Fusarium oxysporum TaxID=5507 RepID=X0CBR1_FUSOX|nr:hypothetical protein FOQG_15331 [Fusarium oxysporum f. sp. raphani 54005]KAG7425672.1 Satratoxin biosynthesis SC1 cluster protein 4 [Fusarium oxysporum f. sp. raphani]